jgi:hypothetical protein
MTTYVRFSAESVTTPQFPETYNGHYPVTELSEGEEFCTWQLQYAIEYGDRKEGDSRDWARDQSFTTDNLPDAIRHMQKSGVPPERKRVVEILTRVISTP